MSGFGVRRSVLALVVGCALTVAPLGAQEVIELTGDDRQLNASFEELYRVGSFDGELWETFGEIAGTAFDEVGNLYIFDRQSSRIVVIDRDGNFVRDFGQEGEGPGEMRMALQFTVLPDGRSVVADLGHRAYQIFGPDGEFQRMVGMGGGGMIRLGDLQADRTSEAIISGGGGSVMAMSATAGPGGGAPAAPTTRPIDRIVLSGDEVTTETIAEGWLPPAGDPETLEGGGMRLSMSMSGPKTFEPSLLAGVLPNGGVAFSDSSAYAIKIARPEGGVSRILRRPFAPEPVTERIQEAEKERRLAELEAGDGPRMQVRMVGPGGGGAQSVSQDAINEMMRNRINQMQFFHEVPVVRLVRTSWGGKIWVQRRGDEPTTAGPIDILTTEGQYVGSYGPDDLEMPAAFGPDGMAAFIERDEFDVPTVIVKRLPRVVN